MGAIITRREYTNEFRPEVTSWLLGNVGDKISLELDVEISISVDSTLSNPFDSNGSNQIIRSTGSFLEDGRWATGFLAPSFFLLLCTLLKSLRPACVSR